MSPIDAKELARLRALVAEWDAAIESGPSRKVEDAYNAVTEAVMDNVNALLDAAEAREGLAFVPIAGEQRSLRAMAADGAIYGAWWFDGTWRFRQMGCIETFGAFATLNFPGDESNDY